jgi:hypothetical protein
MRGIVKYSATIVTVVMLSVGLSGCGNPLKKDEPEIAVTGKNVFESGLQTVKIVERDAAGVANEHPLSISAENMRTVLESLYVTDTILFNKRQTPLFSAGELQILGGALSSGLSRAEPNQDVTFVTIGAHQGAFAKERETNSGRVFYSGGQLHIIFGLVRELYRDKDPVTNQPIDRRVDPLLPGTRRLDSAPSKRIALDNGQAYYIDPKTGKERSDWIVLDIPTILSTMAERKASTSEGFLSPELREDIARNKQETSNLREDMANIKEVLFEMSDKLDKLQKELDTMKSE